MAATALPAEAEGPPEAAMAAGAGDDLGGGGGGFGRAFRRLVGADAGAGAGAGREQEAGAMLGTSAGLKRRRERERAEGRRQAERRRAKRERVERGHLPDVRKGLDPDSDRREKHLARVATRGVVRLFNAVYKAQKLSAQEGADRPKAVALTKAALMTSLQQGSQGRRAAEAAAAAAAANGGEGEDGAAPGWEVLQEDFTGLASGKRLKDWDKAAPESALGGEVDGEEDDSSSED